MFPFWNGCCCAISCLVPNCCYDCIGFVIHAAPFSSLDSTSRLPFITSSCPSLSSPENKRFLFYLHSNLTPLLKKIRTAFLQTKAPFRRKTTVVHHTSTWVLSGTRWVACIHPEHSVMMCLQICYIIPPWPYQGEVPKPLHSSCGSCME